MGGRLRGLACFFNVNNVMSATAPEADSTLEKGLRFSAKNEEKRHVVDVVERLFPSPDFEPYTSEKYFPKGKKDPAFRTKLTIAWQLVQRAVEQGWPFRAAMADNFYGEDRGLKQELHKLGAPSVMALKPSHAWYHPEEVASALQDVAHGCASSESSVTVAHRIGGP